ncbi:MAG: two-component regulator propeller domain-containing protein, partial [Fluviicola sp.]
PEQFNPDDSYGVTDITTDKKGIVWIATYSALFNFDGKKIIRFDAENFNLKTNEKLHIRSVLADSKGRIWIGNNGIGVILKSKDKISHFSREQGKLMPMNEFETNIKTQQFQNNIGLQSVFVIVEDSKGNIWFGDRDSGAWKYDGKKLTNYIIDPKLNSQMIWSIYEDQNKNLLFGMSEGGVYKFNGKSFEKQF